MFKIATWNVNSINVRLSQVLEWVKRHKPDVLALQETKIANEKFPTPVWDDIGYQALYNGQKRYNGVALLHRHRSKNTLTDIPSLVDPQRRILVATIAGYRIINLYVPNGQSVGSEKYRYKLNWLSAVRRFIQQELTQYPNTIVLGDFNIAPRDQDVYDPEAWQGNVLVSPEEREHFQQLLELGLQDSFCLFEPQDPPYSWWDYRAAAFRRNLGLRIDHILISTPLIAHCRKTYVDKSTRSHSRPSDHAAVITEFDA